MRSGAPKVVADGVGPTDHIGADPRVESRRVPHRLCCENERPDRAGRGPWQQPWKPGERRLPENVATKRPYRGGNSVYLSVTQIAKGYSDNRWATYKQIQELGGQVRTGEKATYVLFYKFDDDRKEQQARRG